MKEARRECARRRRRRICRVLVRFDIFFQYVHRLLCFSKERWTKNPNVFFSTQKENDTQKAPLFFHRIKEQDKEKNTSFYSWSLRRV